MVKYTKARVLRDFKGECWMRLKTMTGDRVAKNELWWEFVDAMVKNGQVTQAQWQRWSNPF